MVITLSGSFTYQLSFDQHNNEYAKQISNYRKKALPIVNQADALKSYYKCDHISVYLIHNGTIYAGDFHDKKFDLVFESRRENFNKDMMDLVDIPLSNMIEECQYLDEKEYLYIDNAASNKTYLSYLLSYYGSNSSVIIPIHKMIQTDILRPWHTERVLIGAIAYEYKRVTNFDNHKLLDMSRDAKSIQEILIN